jgi:hypothetical protein
MAVPTIPLNASLADLLRENSFTLGKLQSHPLAVPFTPQFDAFHTLWQSTDAARTTLLVAVDKADGAVSAADDALDDFVDTLDRTLLIAVKNDRKNPVYQLYFGEMVPSDLKRPILGDELARVRKFIPSLQGSPMPSVAALAPSLVTAVAAADAAVAAKVAAAQALVDFDVTGGKATLISAFNALRQTTYGQLAAIPHQQPAAALPATFGDRFFRHNTKTGTAAAKTVADAQADVARHQKKLTAAQNHLANLTATETARAAAKTTAATSETAAEAAQKAADEANAVAEAAAKKAAEDKAKTKKRR